MSVTREAPYSVKRVDELLDPNNENIGIFIFFRHCYIFENLSGLLQRQFTERLPFDFSFLFVQAMWLSLGI